MDNSPLHCGRFLHSITDLQAVKNPQNSANYNHFLTKICNSSLDIFFNFGQLAQ